MKRLSLIALPLFALVCIVGCGGDSGPAAPATSQSEIAEWVKDNPSPPETPVD